jgi:hypothetical protein
MAMPPPSVPSSQETAAGYGSAIAGRNLAAMAALRTPGCMVDLVYRDAYGQNSPGLDPGDFYRSLFDAFVAFDFEITRSLAAAGAVFSEWTLRGQTSGLLKAPLFAEPGSPPAAGRAIRLRGASLFEISNGRIQREIIYFDYLTLMVEVGAAA